MNREQAFLLLLLAASGLASVLIVLPFLEYVLAAMIFAYVLYPVNSWIEPYLGRRVTPIVVILGGVGVLAVPLVFVGLVLFQDLQALAAGETGLDLVAIEETIMQYTGEAVDLSTLAADVSQELTDVLFGNVSRLVTLGFDLTIGLALVFFLMYYALRDGPAFVRWSGRVVPLDVAVFERLLDQVDRTTRGVVVGHIFVAVLQGVAGGLAFLIVGLPNVIFWTFVMVIFSLLPLIGAFVVWGPAVAYLWLIDRTGAAVFLLLWGLFVISLIDEYARPIVIDQSAHLNPGVILVGVFGGIYTIGFTGIFVGPIVLGVFAATLVAFHEDFDALSYDTPPPDRPAPEDRFTWLLADDERPGDPAGDAVAEGQETPDGNPDGLSDAEDSPGPT